MSAHLVVASESVVCTVPGERKAAAVTECFGDGVVSPGAPSSVLEEHPRAQHYLDEASASLLATT